jgi:GNAT superfamily N-acetyltransferase
MGKAAPVASPSIEVVPATPDRWADVVTILGTNGDRGCWCQAPRGIVPGGRSSVPGARRAALRAQLDDDPPPGMLAYVDGEVAGWCGFGPRPRLPRLVRSTTIPAIDDRPVWSILCFNIRVGYRRRGVAAALLAGVVDYARRSGAPGVEAYPIDPEGGRVDVGFGYVGLTPMFDKAGFRRVLETGARSDRRPRWLMRLDFDEPAAGAS